LYTNTATNYQKFIKLKGFMNEHQNQLVKRPDHIQAC